MAVNDTLQINGDLLKALWESRTIIHFQVDPLSIRVLTRDYLKRSEYPFQEFETDEEGIFKLTVSRKGSQPTVVESFLRNNEPVIKNPVGRPPKWRKGMTRGEWEERNYREGSYEA